MRYLSCLIIFCTFIFYPLTSLAKPHTEDKLAKPILSQPHTEDKNGDGKPDLWGYYSEQGDLERVELDDNFDGKIDNWQTYQAGKILTMVRDTNFDGKKDTWDYFEQGIRTRQEQDQDGDGKVDLWVQLGKDEKVAATSRDTNKDGKPDLWIEYDEQEKPKVEKCDRDFNGQVELIKHYQNGELTDRFAGCGCQRQNGYLGLLPEGAVGAGGARPERGWKDR